MRLFRRRGRPNAESRLAYLERTFDPQVVASVVYMLDGTNTSFQTAAFDASKRSPDILTQPAYLFSRSELLKREVCGEDRYWPWLASMFKRESLQDARDGFKCSLRTNIFTNSVFDHWNATMAWALATRPNIMGMSWDDAQKAQRAWHRKQEKLASDRAALAGETVFRWPDGWTVQHLTTAAQLKSEGDIMGHCVGSYSDRVADDETHIFSIRDARGRPHVTVEVQADGGVEQIKAKKNRPASPALLERVADWLEDADPAWLEAPLLTLTWSLRGDMVFAPLALHPRLQNLGAQLSAGAMRNAPVDMQTSSGSILLHQLGTYFEINVSHDVVLNWYYPDTPGPLDFSERLDGFMGVPFLRRFLGPGLTYVWHGQINTIDAAYRIFIETSEGLDQLFSE